MSYSFEDLVQFGIDKDEKKRMWGLNAKPMRRNSDEKHFSKVGREAIREV